MSEQLIQFIVQFGSLGLCIFMMYHDEKRRIADRKEHREDIARMSAAIDEKDIQIREMVAENQKLTERSIRAEERSTRVFEQITEQLKEIISASRLSHSSEQ